MKRISLRILIALVVMFFGMTAFAQQGATSYNLVVLLKNGAADSYELAQKPLITYGVQTMMITSDGVETSYDLAQVADFHFEAQETAIETVESDFLFRQSAPNIFSINGSKGVSVFDTAGRMIQNFTAEEEIVVDLNTQNTGVYIIAIKGVKKNQSIKILKK